MPLHLDRHDLDGFDYERQAAFCLVDAPGPEAAEAVHREAHGMVASRIIEVDPRRVEEFLGDLPQARPA